MRVLAADDDEALLKVLARYLKGWGYEATIASGGMEAWKILKREDAPSVVILDWDMPDLSGIEVCRLFRSTSHGAAAYVLMLTGRVEKEDLVQALESGADDFLSKPFHGRELQLRLAKGVRDAARGATRTAGTTSIPPSGSVLSGKYRLEKKIGEGGMGSVWLGVHLSLGINIAIKFMAKDLADVPDYVSFEREARAAALLRNEHIVRVYDHGVAADGTPYLVMEYLSGDSLAQWVDKRGPLTPFALASLVEQTASALTAAHEQRVVHRDVKPENILMLEDVDQPAGFSVKLIDFGLAKPFRLPETDGPGKEHKGGICNAGTPSYMSPECLTASAPPGPLLDLWGLAVTIYFAATGGLPFGSDNLSELFRQICTDPLPIATTNNPALPPGFDEWFGRACAREPEARYPSAAELAHAFRSMVPCDTHVRVSPASVKVARTLVATELDPTRVSPLPGRGSGG